MRAQRIRAGELRTPLMLGQPTYAQDDAGARTQSWVETAVFGKLEPSSGREWLSNSTLRDQVDTAITLRRMAVVPTSTWRIRDPHSGVIYSVIAVMVHPKANLVELGCKSITGNPSDGR